MLWRFCVLYAVIYWNEPSIRFCILFPCPFIFPSLVHISVWSLLVWLQLLFKFLSFVLAILLWIWWAPTEELLHTSLPLAGFLNSPVVYWFHMSYLPLSNLTFLPLTCSYTACAILSTGTVSWVSLGVVSVRSILLLKDYRGIFKWVVVFRTRLLVTGSLYIKFTIFFGSWPLVWLRPKYDFPHCIFLCLFSICNSTSL